MATVKGEEGSTKTLGRGEEGIGGIDGRGGGRERGTGTDVTLSTKMAPGDVNDARGNGTGIGEGGREGTGTGTGRIQGLEARDLGHRLGGASTQR